MCVAGINEPELSLTVINSSDSNWRQSASSVRYENVDELDATTCRFGVAADDCGLVPEVVMTIRRRAVGSLALATALGSALGAAWLRSRYVADLDAARARVAQGSRIVATRSGPIEVGIGEGERPLLMIHGTGGGFDQGLQFAECLTAAGWRMIAPWRRCAVAPWRRCASATCARRSRPMRRPKCRPMPSWTCSTR